jgi:NAD(P)-dependent dehydrogenase (short-subunit alcohol dehydrogenase family)
MSRRVVLVTGASSGIGQRAAAAFVARGHRVFGTSRAAQGAVPDGVTRLPLDVCDDGSVSACIEAVERSAGRLDVLVNNAGLMRFGPIEEVPTGDARALFETNFWGVTRMVNAVLPLMRQKASGHIVNVGSVAGTTAIPLNGFYAATKHALAGYTEALRHEVASFGVRVALVEPSDFRSGLWSHAAVVPSRIGAYAPLRARVLRAVDDALARAPDPAPVAEVIVRVAESDAPSLRNPVGTWAHLLPRMKAWMPAAMFEAGVRRRFLGAP